MKIFTAEQIRACDQWTVQHEQVSSLMLMEKAAGRCADWFASQIKSERFWIFCGNGNNGGDGFAIARMLYRKGFDIDVFIDFKNPEYSEDARINLQKLKEISGVDIHDFRQVSEMKFKQDTTIVDAIFGSGFHGSLSLDYQKLIAFLNSIQANKVSIDIPTGLSADGLSDSESVFIAYHTLSLQFWKKSFLHPETGKFCGKIHILDIGLSPEFIQKTDTSQYIISDSTVQKIYRPREQFSHKGTYGKVHLIAGSYGKIGAAILAARAAVRTGAGLVTVQAPECGFSILQTACPEAMMLSTGNIFSEKLHHEEGITYGIGPGLGTESETQNAFLEFLKKINTPIVLDADALNIIALDNVHLELIPKNSILTPHPKEFERLFGTSANSFKRLEIAKENAAKFGIFIVLKDRYTQIITPKKTVYYNITGNPGMATGGSGDVLTGIITALLAQKYSSEEVAILGVWLHGKAGDDAAKMNSEEALIAGDLPESLGRVFNELKNSHYKKPQNN